MTVLALHILSCNDDGIVLELWSSVIM